MDARPGPSIRRARRGRLSRSADFDRVYRQGTAASNRYLVLHTFPRPEGADAGDGARLGLSVSRRVGGAVERNRIKRLLREAFGEHREQLPAGLDVVVVARPDVRDLADREGLDGVTAALRELLGRGSTAAGNDGD